MTGSGSSVTRVARWSVRHPGWAIGLWLAFVAAAVVLGGTVETRATTDADLRYGESGRAAEIVAAGEFPDPATEQVLITPRQDWDPAAARGAAAATPDRGRGGPRGGRAAADATADRLRGLPAVAAVGDPAPSPTADALLLPVTLHGEPETAEARVAPVLAALAAVEADHPGLRVETVGDGSGPYGVNQVVEADLGRAGLLSVPVTLGVLLLAFGALLAAGVPLLLALSAVAAATGLYGVASQVFPDFGAVPHVILLIGLAVGVDYSLFYLRREREERRRGLGHVDAVAIAAATSGRAVVVSGFAVLVSMAGLFLAQDAIFAGLAAGAMIVVGVAVAGSLTVLPAVLALLGRAVDRPRVPLLWRLTDRSGPPRLWPALLRPALRAPRATLLVTLAGMLVLALPALGMSLKNADIEDLPRDIPVVAAYHRLVAAFPGEGNAHLVAVRAPAGQAEAVRAALADLHRRAAADPRFAPAAEPAIRTSADGTVSTLEVPVPFPEGAPELAGTLTSLRTDLVPATVGEVPGAGYAVGGGAAESLDYTDHQSQRLPWVIGFVVALTVAMMAFAFRSVVVALVAGALNVVSVAAAFGLLTLVFQHLTGTGHIVSWVPLFLFVVLFGLSMDYHVFVVSRIREAAAAGLDTAAAVREGIVRSAPVVTSAAAVMVAVFAIFGTLTLIEMRQLGVGLAAAIAIDATIVRIFLLPAVMTQLGRANWWPSRLSRRPAATALPPPAVRAGLADRR